jgi:hypothetical protein
MRLARRVVVAAAMVAIASCAHDEPAAQRPVAVAAPAAPGPAASRRKPASAAPLNRRALMSIGDAGYESWISRVRECTAADVAGAKPQLLGAQAELAKRKPTVSIAGRLVPARPDCTLIDCGDGCCNQCTVDWVVVPRRCPRRTVKVSLRGSAGSLSGCAMDCAVRGYGQEADWVIVSGTIGDPGDVVLDAELCRLRSSAELETKDLLTDADHQRLINGGRPDPRADCGSSPQ